jgi:alpha-glucosidase
MDIRSVDRYRKLKNGVELSCGPILARILLVQDNILRVWSTARRDFHPEETYVVEERELPGVPVRIEERKGVVVLSGKELTLTVHLDPFWMRLSDSSGQELVCTPPEVSLSWNGEKAVQRFVLPADVRVYGLGQGASAVLDLRGQERRMWQQWDGFRYSGNGGIPFLMTSRGYGVLLNSSWASRFAIGSARCQPSTSHAKPAGPWAAGEPSGELHPERYAILTEGGDMDLFLIHGPEYRRIIRGYGELTGFPPLPPKWALGWIQCKNRYKSQEQLLEVGREYRRRGLPCDALVIDWCWFERFGYLQWVPRYWPDPAGMARELKSLGIHIMQAQHPYMHQDSPHFRDFESQGFLFTWDPAELPDRWPPDGIRHAVDFSNPGARALWWQKIEPLFRQGIDGYWTDMGEIETHPPSSSPHYLGRREKVHNIYSTLWNKALYDGQRGSSDRRVFSLSRTAYAGIQRYGAAMWSGDIDPSWEVLEDQVVIGQQVCLSGQPYWTTDIGGFGTAGFFEPELYVRWLQWGVFCPIFRTHGTRPENEPWSFGPAAEPIIGNCLRMRYRLMPYIYSLAWETWEIGLSMMRAMFVEFPDEQRADSWTQQFMFGPSLLVAPVTRKGARRKEVWLPPGVWYRYGEDRKQAGPMQVQEAAPLDRIPLFVRGGSILPEGPEVLHTGSGPLDPLTLHVYPGNDARFRLYEDDGQTYDYEQGIHALTEIEYKEKSRSIKISAAQGGYPGFPAERSLRFVLHDCPCPSRVTANGEALDPGSWRYQRTRRSLEVALPRRSTSAELLLKLKGTDPQRDDSPSPGPPSCWAGYDLENIEPPGAQILRIYLNGGNSVLKMPLGWSCRPLSEEDLATRFEITPDGKAFTADSMATAIVSGPGGEESKAIQLGSGWATWWRLVGPYRVEGPEGFDQVYGPERNDESAQKKLEPGIGSVVFRGFECFGYVNLDKQFAPKDITEMVAAVAEHKLCYAICVADSPEPRDCLFQLMGEDRFKVWLNGRLQAIIHDCAAKPVEVPVRLRKGENRVVLKCTQDAHREWNDRAWGFHFRFVNDGRKPLPDVVYRPG